MDTQAQSTPTTTTASATTSTRAKPRTLDSPPRGVSPPRKRARPAFNPGLLASPFYRQPAYGGGGPHAARTASPHARLPPLYSRPRSALNVSPGPGANNAPVAPLSRAAQRIAELLAQCESPVADARRRERPGPPPPPTPGPPPRRELRAPALATLLRLKQHNRCVGSAQAALAASLSSSAPYDPTDYSLPQPDPPLASQRSTNKIRARTGVERRPPQPQPRPAPVNLPDVPLPLPPDRLPDLRLGPLPLPDRRPGKKFVFREPLNAYDAALPSSRFCEDGDKPALNGPAPKTPEKPTAKIPTLSWNGTHESGDKTSEGDKTKPKPDLGRFMKRSDQWECDSCMLRNDNDKLKCVCCETPKPGDKSPVEAKPTAALPGLTGFIKKQQEQWECSCCMTRNDKDKNKCVCCEAAKPGAEPAAKAPEFNFGSAQNSTFKFGIDKADDASKPANKIDSKPSAGFTFGMPPTETPATKLPEIKFGVPNGIIPTEADKPNSAAPPTAKEDTPKTSPIVNFTFGVKPVDKNTPISDSFNSFSRASPEVGKFTFSSAQSVMPSDSKEKSPLKVESPVTINPLSPPKPEVAISKKEPTVTSPLAAISPASVPANPPLFSFGQSQPPVDQSNAVKFNFGAKDNQPAESAFKPSSVFSFGSANKVSAPATEPPKPIESLAKTPFSLPMSNPGSLFPVVTQASASPVVVKPITNDLTNSNIQFSIPSQTEKPKDQSVPPLFSFKADPPAATKPETNLFKNSAVASAPVFSFGASAMSKTAEPPKPSIFGSAQIMPPANIFGSPPANEVEKNSSGSLFKVAPATSSFTSNTGSIFNSKPATPNAQLTPNLFGSPSMNENKPVFGSGAPNTGNHTFSSNNMFANPPVNSFASNNIFGSAQAPTNPPPANLFGSNKPANDPAAGMFGNKLQSPQTQNIFNSSGPGLAPAAPTGGVFGVTTPVFGATIPFGDPSQTQAPQNPQFKFGESNPAQPNIGQAPAPGSSAPVFSFGAPPQPTPMTSQFNFSMGAQSPVTRIGPGGVNSTVPQRRYMRAIRRNPPQ